MAQADRSLVLVGGFREEAVRHAKEAASSVGATTALVNRCEEAIQALGEIGDPLAVVIRMDAEGAAQAFAHIRAQARMAQLPILGVVAQRDDVAFTELFSWGGDDLLALDSAPPLARRLRPLAAPSRQSGPVEPKPRERAAVIAGADARWRSVMGRAIYQGGFAVRFCGRAEDLAAEAQADGVHVVVVTDDLGEGRAEEALRAARAAGSQRPWIVVAPPKRMAALSAAIAPLGPVSVADGFAPPENVLFLTNEALSRRGVDKRSSPRILYGTTVHFRSAGRDEDEIGFSYNVSAGGLFVRTLAPLEAEQEVWLELWPPRSERRVRVAGTVAWKRAFGPSEWATVPPGFGVRVTDGLAGDLDRWKVGYQVFADTVLGARK